MSHPDDHPYEDLYASSDYEHTPTPWSYQSSDEYTHIVRGPLGEYLLSASQHSSKECAANAQRVVACVNACAKYSTEVLEAAGEGYFHKAVGEMIADIKMKAAAIHETIERISQLESALNDILRCSEPTPVLTYQKMESIAKEALGK